MEKIKNFFKNICFSIIPSILIFCSCKIKNQVVLEPGQLLESSKFQYISCCPHLITCDYGNVIVKQYTVINTELKSYIYYMVDENNYIRCCDIAPYNIFGHQKVLETSEKYSIYTDLNDIDEKYVNSFESVPFLGKYIFLKSKWGLCFQKKIEYYGRDYQIRNKMSKIDLTYFKLLEEKCRINMIDEEWNNNRKKQIREEIKKEGIPYG